MSDPIQTAPADDTTPGGFHVRTAEADGAFVLALHGELDVAGVETLREAIHRAEDSDCPGVVVDLSGLEFIDSIGLRELLRLHRRLQPTPRTLSLCPGGRQVRRVFEVAGLTDVLPFSSAR